MVDKSKYLKITKKSPLAFKVKAIASELFSAWVLEAKRFYPQYAYEADSKTLTQDIISCFPRDQ